MFLSYILTTILLYFLGYASADQHIKTSGTFKRQADLAGMNIETHINLFFISHIIINLSPFCRH